MWFGEMQWQSLSLLFMFALNVPNNVVFVAVRFISKVLNVGWWERKKPKTRKERDFAEQADGMRQ